MTCFAVVWATRIADYKLSFFLSMSKPLLLTELQDSFFCFSFFFVSQTTLNNRGMIAETRSYIFRLRSRCRRRRLSFNREFKQGIRSASPGEALLIPCVNDGKNCLSMPSHFVGLELIWCYISRFLEEGTGR